ncbi:hypothetical protein GOAMI_24_00930 [Gordonia amicalis NBRC 100051 = JCM 11271]|nr:hypothetical protein GOAMI_24_00930 [Gordonia amicalis NBRC 100051 = JCM 11271]
MVDSYSERTAARVRAATAEDMARAVDVARASFDGGEWARKSPAGRADVIDTIADRLEARVPELTTLGIVEVGVTAPVSAMTQQMVLGLYRAVAAEARKVNVVEERPRADGGVSRIVKEPTGVVAAIIPWNGPIGSIAFKVIPALAAGCSVVLKTSPEAPLSPSVFADVVAELVEEGVIPEGVLSVLVADREVSESLVVNPKVVEHCQQVLADFKVPRYVVIRQDPLPRLPSGKIAKTVIRDEYKDVDTRFDRVR